MEGVDIDMINKEFLNLFEQQRKDFTVQNMLGKNQIRVLEMFEHWIKKKVPKNTPTGEKNELTSTKNKDFGVFLDEIISEAGKLLLERGIIITNISLDKSISLKQSSKCIKAFNHLDIYYRICKCRPRKGKYKGRKLFTIELVMDGYKSSIFMPLIKKKETMEEYLGMEVERESEYIEKTGKYRFKICFPFREIVENEYALQDLSYFLAEFIYITRKCINDLGLSQPPKMESAGAAHDDIRYIRG